MSYPKFYNCFVRPSTRQAYELAYRIFRLRKFKEHSYRNRQLETLLLYLSMVALGEAADAAWESFRNRDIQFEGTFSKPF